jgi:hypothetical protein
LGVNVRSSAAAEKSGEGMALKIFTGAKPFLKANIMPFDITEIGTLPVLHLSVNRSGISSALVRNFDRGKPLW